MKRVTCIAGGVMLFAASSAAQAPSTGQKVNFSTSLQRAYATLKEQLTQAAEDMPEAKYRFNPVAQPDLRPVVVKNPGVGNPNRTAESKPSRTYGQLIGHQTDNLFNGCATLKGVPNPSESSEKKAMKATKAELVKAMADALAFCDGAIAALTDQNALEMIKRGEGEAARGAVVAALLSHGHGSASAAAVYLRLNGIARPW